MFHERRITLKVVVFQAIGSVPAAGHFSLEIGFDESVQFAVHDGGHLADLMSGPMVFDHLVWLKHVGTDLTAPGDILFSPTIALNSGFLLALFQLKQAGAQNFHGSVAVLELGPLVLALHDDTGRDVCNADGGFHFVDVLPSGAAGAERINRRSLSSITTCTSSSSSG